MRGGGDHRRRPSATGRWSAAIALAVAAAACSPHAAREAKPVGPPTIATELLGHQDDRASTEAIERLVQACMRRRGETYARRPFYADEVVQGGAQTSRRAVLAHGFGLSRPPQPKATPLRPDPNIMELSRRSDRAVERWEDAQEACFAEADATIARRARALQRRLRPADRRFLTSLIDATEPRLARAGRAWRACMRRHGYQDQAPDQLQARLTAAWQARVDSGSPHPETFFPEERRAALASWDCSQRYVKPLADRLLAEANRRIARYGVRSLYD